MGVEEQIREIEEEMARTQYNKATQGHIGRLKAKLARLKVEKEKKSGGAHGLGYALRKTGDATVILVGFPSVGKSTLLNSLTNARSKIAPYDFTTLTVIPGVLEHKGARIQILDIPGLIEEASSGKGRGREVLSVVRNADMLIIIVAGTTTERQQQKKVIENELATAGFRLNQRPPDVKVTKKSGGGIKIGATKKLSLSLETVREILREFHFLNAEIIIREDVNIDQLIDCLTGNRIYIPALFVANKADLVSDKRSDFLNISALRKEGIDPLKEAIWDALGLKRIYLKKPGKEADLTEPYIMRGDVTIEKVCQRFNLLKHFQFARIWGSSARFPGQTRGLFHKLRDGDVVEVHNR